MNCPDIWVKPFWAIELIDEFEFEQDAIDYLRLLAQQEGFIAARIVRDHVPLRIRCPRHQPFPPWRVQSLHGDGSPDLATMLPDGVHRVLVLPAHREVFIP